LCGARESQRDEARGAAAAAAAETAQLEHALESVRAALDEAREDAQHARESAERQAGETVSWALGFGLAGFGMLLGLVVFIIGKPLLRGNGEAPDPAKLKQKVAGINLEWLLYGVGLVGVAVIWALIQFQEAVGWILLVAGIGLLAYVLYLALYDLVDERGNRSDRSTTAIFFVGVGLLFATAAWMIVNQGAGNIAYAGGALGLGVVIAACVIEARKYTNHARDRVFAMIFFILLMPLFWGLFEQAGGSMNLFTDR
jgi:POT family proton-dependent oligopeptide transporter